LWTDVAWPVLAGSLAALGVFGASLELGFAQFLAVSAAGSLFAVSWVLALVFGVYHEIGHRGPRLVRMGLAATVVAMALFGLAQLFAGYGLLAAAAVAMTSPTATRLLARFQRPVGRATTAPPAPRVLMDQEMVDREFDDIVAGLSEMDDHFPES
jgi:hypothetical protein